MSCEEEEHMIRPSGSETCSWRKVGSRVSRQDDLGSGGGVLIGIEVWGFARHLGTTRGSSCHLRKRRETYSANKSRSKHRINAQTKFEHTRATREISDKAGNQNKPER